MSYSQEMPLHLRLSFVPFQPDYSLVHIFPKGFMNKLKKLEKKIMPTRLDDMWGDWLDIPAVALFDPTDPGFKDNFLPACDAYSMLWAKGLYLSPIVSLWLQPELRLWKCIVPDTTYLVLSVEPIPFSAVLAIREEKSFAL